jgi:hypothetical protein
MSTMTGTYRDGRIELDAPVDWPEGKRVYISGSEPGGRFLTDETWPDTPEGRAALAERMRTFEPVELSSEDEAEIAAAREAVRRVTLEAVRNKTGLEL